MPKKKISWFQLGVGGKGGIQSLAQSCAFFFLSGFGSVWARCLQFGKEASSANPLEAATSWGKTCFVSLAGPHFFANFPA